jgi:EAL domain-containing protein (putative c-di-GMP-specific phosphodiesterase class I)
MNLGKNEDDAIVRAIVTLAQTLGLKITCEGIETEAQLAELKRLRCDRGQGYLFSKPLPVDKFDEILADNAGCDEDNVNLGSIVMPLDSKAA